MFRANSLIQQQFKRSRNWLVRPGALLLGAGSLTYLLANDERRSQQDDSTSKKNQFEALLTRSSSTLAAFPSTIFPRPTFALCDENKVAVRQKREREIAIIRDMLLENPNLKPKVYKRGHVIHKEGELKKGLCIVLDGEISLSAGGRWSVSKKHKGDIFGALSLVTEGYGPRRFTARCISPECTIVEIGQEEFDKAIEAHPELRKGLKDICLCQEFQRILVLHTKKHFPTTPGAMGLLFRSIRYTPGTELKLLDVIRVIRSVNRRKTDKDIEDIFAAMDVDGNGGLSVDEFEALFYKM